MSSVSLVEWNVSLGSADVSWGGVNSTYYFNSSSDCGGFMCRKIVLYIEHTNKAFNKEKNKRLLIYSISSILMSCT